MTKKIWLSLLVVVALVSLYGLAAYACGNCGGKGNCPAAMKDAKVEVSNLDNGITVQITSDNPEAVKAIQKCKGDCKCDGLKDVKFQSKKVDNGIILTITSKDPEAVKLIQDKQANCFKNCQTNGATGCSGKMSGKCCGGKTSGCGIKGTKITQP